MRERRVSLVIEIGATTSVVGTFCQRKCDGERDRSMFRARLGRTPNAERSTLNAVVDADYEEIDSTRIDFSGHDHDGLFRGDATFVRIDDCSASVPN